MYLLSDNAVVPLSEEVVLLVELPLVLADGDIEALLLEVGLLLLAYGGFLQNLGPHCSKRDGEFCTPNTQHAQFSIVLI